jgi:hypothetical protein
MKISPTWARRIQAALVGAIAGSMIAVVLKLREQIIDYPWDFQPAYLVLSTTLVVIATLYWAIFWAWMLKRMYGSQASLVQTANIYIYGNTAKYLPGSVWNYFARGYLGTRIGIPASSVWIVSLYEILLALFTGAAVYLLSLGFPHQHQPAFSIEWVGLVTVGLFLSLSPPAIQLAISLAGRILKRSSEGIRMRYSYLDYLTYTSFSFFTWVLVGAGFYLLVRSVIPLPFYQLPEFAGLWGLAVVISLASIGIPQGIGIKEGVLVLAMAASMPVPAAVGIAVLSRIWTIACEVISTGLWWLFGAIGGRIIPKNY